MSNDVTTFKELVEAWRVRLDINSELFYGEEPDWVTIEDGTRRPNIAMVLQQFLGNANVYADYDEGLKAVGDNGFFAVAGHDGAYQVGYIVKDGEVTELGRIPSTEGFASLLNLSSLIDFSDDDYAIRILDALNRTALALGWDATLEVVKLLTKNGIDFGGVKINQQENSQFIAEWSDSDGNVSLALGWNGKLYSVDLKIMRGIELGNVNISTDISKWAAQWEDSQGNIGMALSNDGAFHVPQLIAHDAISATTAKIDRIDAKSITINGEPVVAGNAPIVIGDGYTRPVNPLFGVVYLPTYGQSQQDGWYSRIILEGHDTANPNAKMPKMGLRVGIQYNNSASDAYSPVALQEGISSHKGETTASSLVNKIAEDNPNGPNNEFFLFSANPSRGGYEVSQLTVGTDSWERFERAFQAAADYADSLGLPLSVPMLSWWQGGSDESRGRSKDHYLENFYKIYNGLKDLIAKNNGIDDPANVKTPLLLVQTNNHLGYEKGTGAISEAQLQIAEEHDDVVPISSYWMTPGARENYDQQQHDIITHDNTVYDNVHCDAISYARTGVYHAIAIRERVVNGDESFKGVRPKSWWKIGNLLVIEFYYTYGGLQFWDGPEDAPIADVDNQGFSAVDADGNDIQIKSVAITGKNKVVVKIDRDWDANDVIQYAVTGFTGIKSNKYGRMGGSRGKLFDLNGERDKFKLNGKEYEFHFPCVQFWKKVG